MFKFESGKCYRMPVHFGGSDYKPTELCYHDVVSMIFTYTTDEDLLSKYIPECFELIEPKIFIHFAQCRQIDWMAGSGYNLVDVSVPVRFKGKRDQLEGSMSLVVWEDDTVPICGGREETGVPKVFADIEDLHALGDKRFTTLSFEGNSFLRMEMSITAPLNETQMAPMRCQTRNALNLRYIPKVGGPGAELCQTILYPQRSEAEQGWQGNGSIEWITLRYEQHPSQAHIINALAELPILEMSPAMLTKGKTYLMPPMARVLE